MDWRKLKNFDNTGNSTIKRNKILRVLWVLFLAFGTMLTEPLFIYGQNSSGDMFRDRPEKNADMVSAVSSSSVQSEYPAVGKIIGRGEITVKKDENKETLPVYFGTGCYVAELNDYGIVLTNWHVVSDSKSIQVVFPDFCSDAVVLLADETWDIAALVIHKPPFLPIPISLEVPQIGDELWVGGYGPEAGLNDFVMHSGKVYQYMILEPEKDLPAETISIKTGVRQGDSGGPAFNKYGELAGILWGTNGEETMFTFCLRMQAFLTQAQFQLINADQDPNAFFASMSSGKKIKKIIKATTPAQTALQSSGIYPISTRPVYLSSDSKKSLEGGTIPSVKGIPLRHPPFPALESPTLLAQREVIGRSHPEVYPEDTPFLKKRPQTSVYTRNSAEQENPFKNVSQSVIQGNAPEKLKVSQTGQETEIVQNKEGIASDDKKDSDAAKKEIKNPEKKAEENQNEKSLFYNFKMNDIQLGIVIVLLLFLFFNSLRFLAIAGEK